MGGEGGWKGGEATETIERQPWGARRKEKVGWLRTLLLQQCVLPLQVVYVLLVCVIFSSHVLDVLCGFV